MIATMIVPLTCLRKQRMADSLSFGLSNAGFPVSKYMPFGPMELVMPYLLKNRGLLSASTLDRQLEVWLVPEKVHISKLKKL